MLGRFVFSMWVISLGVVACAQDEPAKSNNAINSEGSEKAQQQDQGNRDAATQDPAKQDQDKKDQGKKDQDKRPDSNSRSERETREIFFRTLNEARSRGAQEFGYLLFQKSVREEVGLDDASAKAARDVLAKSRASGDKLYDQLKHHKITAEELKAEFVKVMAEADREMWDVLGDSKLKRDRLVSLYVQFHKASAVLNKVVAEKVGLDEARRVEIISKKEKIEREMFEESSSQNAEPADRFRAWEKTQKKVHALITEMLTQEHLAKLEELKGEPFEFEQFPFPPPGPPGRGRDGGRDRRNREDRDEKCRDCEKLVNDQR